jgi:hypothetical protein
MNDTPPTGGRGGARRGAGRKPVLTSEQRLEIGAVIHDMLWRETRARSDRAIEAKLAEDDLPTLWAGLDRMRHAHPDVCDRQLADIQAAIEEGILQGRRYVPGPIRIAPGIRVSIIRRAALAASRRWRLTVSERMAERCLEEYRALKARVDAEMAGYLPDIDNPDRD